MPQEKNIRVGEEALSVLQENSKVEYGPSSTQKKKGIRGKDFLYNRREIIKGIHYARFYSREDIGEIVLFKIPVKNILLYGVRKVQFLGAIDVDYVEQYTTWHEQFNDLSEKLWRHDL